MYLGRHGKKSYMRCLFAFSQGTVRHATARNSRITFIIIIIQMASAKAFLLMCATAASAVPLTPVSIKWTQCSDYSKGALPELECGKLSVPLNWTEPSGKKISLGLTRVPSANPNKIGSLVYNPGGKSCIYVGIHGTPLLIAGRAR